METASHVKRNIVVIGGGIIGCTTAYYLTRHPSYDASLHRITVLESTAVAAGASGKAGGLLALWAFPSCLVPLSFRLHKELAAEHGGDQRWGYREVGCGSIAARVSQKALDEQKAEADAGQEGSGLGEGNSASAKWAKLPKQNDAAAALFADSDMPDDLDWLDPSMVTGFSKMGGADAADTAQVHPFHFTTAVSELAMDKGVEFKLRAHVTQIESGGDAEHSVEYRNRDTEELHKLENVTDVVIAAGPWTGKLFPRSKIEPVRAHSVVWNVDVSPWAVFTEISLPASWNPPHRAGQGLKRRHRGVVDPEIYARPFGEVYACGEADSEAPLPETADQVGCDVSRCEDIIAYTATISPALRHAPVKTRQACYLPRHIRFGEERPPLLGPTSTPGLWIAAGHTCWGIQNGPATGCLMAEYIFDGKPSSAEVGNLDPRRFKV